jgi:hypothetical protein
MKRILLGIATFSLGGLTVAGAVVAAREATQPRIGIHGLPIGSGITSSTKLPFLTKDQLYSRGHAEDYVEIQQVFYAYIFYHDSRNAPGQASLFAPDGILEVLNNKDGKTVDPDSGDFHGCIARGPGQVEIFFGVRPGGPRSDQATPIPRPAHDEITDLLVRVDGDTAEVHGRWTAVNADTTHKISPTSAYVDRHGQYIADMVRTSDGWKFAQLRVIHEKAPTPTTNCDAEGALPR